MGSLGRRRILRARGSTSALIEAAAARREPRSVVTLINEETVVSRLNDAPLSAEGASAPFA